MLILDAAYQFSMSVARRSEDKQDARTQSRLNSTGTKTERDYNRIEGKEKLPTTDAIERHAFDQFSARLERTVNEYVNAAEATDSVNRSGRARRALLALLQQVDE